MSLTNQITVVGNFVDDPELRFNDAGKARMTGRIAINDSYKKGDTWATRTTYMNIVAWDGLAENCAQSFVKGDRIVVIGRYQESQYDNASGVRSYYSEIVCNEIAGSVKWAITSMVKSTQAEREELANA